jgi:hypothetical protein
MRARIYTWLVLMPAVLLVLALLTGGVVAADPCPSASGGGC